MPAEINARIDAETEESVRDHAVRGIFEIAARIAELGRKWDLERVRETDAAALAMTGLVLGVVRDRR